MTLQTWKFFLGKNFSFSKWCMSHICTDCSDPKIRGSSSECFSGLSNFDCPFGIL
jgi:hypothetical protein